MFNYETPHLKAKRKSSNPTSISITAATKHQTTPQTTTPQPTKQKQQTNRKQNIQIWRNIHELTTYPTNQTPTKLKSTTDLENKNRKHQQKQSK